MTRSLELIFLHSTFCNFTVITILFFIKYDKKKLLHEKFGLFTD
jgi:hypothetical protein